MKPNLLIDPAFGFAPSGAQIEGLIHTARFPTDNSIELLAPALNGLEWPGGVIALLIKPPSKKSFNRRALLTLFCPLESVGLYQFLAPSIVPVKILFTRAQKNFCRDLSSKKTARV